MTLKENLKVLAEMGVTKEGSTIEGILPLTGDENAKQVAEILAKAKELTGATSPKGDESDENAKPEGNTVLVWIKGQTYVDDKHRVKAGFYRLALPLSDRLTKSPSSVVEIFEGDIPPRKLTEIAKFMGISHPEELKDSQIIEKMTDTPYKPF